ncbi:hypothetical protein MMC30_007913 [Trapelia coarctata]|nr:hypothetical protein [Trapelia coarctata]
MHSSLVRLQNVFGFFTTVAFVVAGLAALSVVVPPQTPSAKLTQRSVQVVKGRPHYYSTTKEEYAHIRFDLEADFSSLFNWNTKQLFVYILATYPSLSPSSPPSQAIIWDLIIPSESQLNPLNPIDFLLTKYSVPPPLRKFLNADAKTTKSKTRAKSPSGTKNKAASAKANGKDKKLGIISLKNEKPKYQITDISGRLAERGNVTLEVGWNVQPWVGALTWTMPEGVSWGRWKGVEGGGSAAFDMPALKGKKVETTARESPKAAEASPIL